MASDKDLWRMHGLYTSSDESDSGKSDFDEEYYKLRPPPIPIENLESKIVRIKPNQFSADKTNESETHPVSPNNQNYVKNQPSETIMVDNSNVKVNNTNQTDMQSVSKKKKKKNKRKRNKNKNKKTNDESSSNVGIDNRGGFGQIVKDESNFAKNTAHNAVTPKDSFKEECAYSKERPVQMFNYENESNQTRKTTKELHSSKNSTLKVNNSNQTDIQSVNKIKKEEPKSSMDDEYQKANYESRSNVVNDNRGNPKVDFRQIVKDENNFTRNTTHTAITPNDSFKEQYSYAFSKERHVRIFNYENKINQTRNTTIGLHTSKKNFKDCCYCGRNESILTHPIKFKCNIHQEIIEVMVFESVKTILQELWKTFF